MSDFTLLPDESQSPPHERTGAPGPPWLVACQAESRTPLHNHRRQTMPRLQTRHRVVRGLPAVTQRSGQMRARLGGPTSGQLHALDRSLQRGWVRGWVGGRDWVESTCLHWSSSAPVLRVTWALIWSPHTPNRLDCPQKHLQLMSLEPLNIRRGSPHGLSAGRSKVAGATPAGAVENGGGKCGAPLGDRPAELGVGGGTPCRGGEGTPQGPSRPFPQGSHSLHSGSARDAACPPAALGPPLIFSPGVAEA